MTRSDASTVQQYLCLLWDNISSAEPVTPIERKAEKLGLITIRKSDSSAFFGGSWHARQITDEGKKVRDAEVKLVASKLSATLCDTLETCHQQPFDGSLSHRALIDRGFAQRANAGPTNDTMRLTSYGRAVLGALNAAPKELS